MASLKSAEAVEPLARCAAELVFGAPAETKPMPRRRQGALRRLCKADAESGESYFLVAYDRRRRAPAWTAYRLTREEMLAAAESGITRRSHGGSFRPEPGLMRRGQAMAQLTAADYRWAGLDRGHLVPAAAMAFDAAAYGASFSLANVALQDPRLNRGLWRELEARVRGWACSRGQLYIVTGVLFARGGDAAVFAPRARPALRIAVPAAFYKLLYDPAGPAAIAFMLENAPPKADLAAAVLSIDDLEDLAGLDFLPEMPAGLAGEIESRAPDPAAWGLLEPAPAPCLDQLAGRRD